MGSQDSRWLLCPPDFFDVRYEINPWMNVRITPDREKAVLQWNALAETFKKLNVATEQVAPLKEWPDMVFTANAGLVHGKKAVLAKFRHPERQGEEPHFERWFSDHGFTVVHLKRGCFEGEGDALFAEELLVGGFGFRSDRPIYDEMGELLNLKGVVPVQLVDSYFYHLDTCFCPIRRKTALFYPPAFNREGIRAMERDLELIPVVEPDARKFACNAVVLGDDIIVPAGCDETNRLLEGRGFRVHPVELGEYMKAGGAAKCLSLRL